MKKLVLAVLVVMLSAGISLAGGDKNCGTKGKGTTGSTGQGSTVQKRAPLGN